MKMTVRQKDLINMISEKTGLYKKDVKSMIVALTEIIYEELKKGNQIVLKTVCKMIPEIIPEHKRFNPKTNRIETRKETKTVKIHASFNLKKAVREND